MCPAMVYVVCYMVRESLTMQDTTYTIAGHIPNNAILNNTTCCHNTLLI